jgi:phosphoketolase|tara:strand:+ start:49305 stop:51695 length:2391 start_codon:yes stop_codon:yes gene_type:complete
MAACLWQGVMMSDTRDDMWKSGYGPLTRRAETVARVEDMAQRLVRRGLWHDEESVYRLVAAADRLASAGMWLVAHMTYARRVDLSGAPLPSEAFKDPPEGHTGGSLNMVTAFVGYLLANTLSGTTRSWIMGQGHCVAAIEAVNALTGDVSPRQKGRYSRSDAGLSQLVSDFYSYAIGADGRPATPLGSHAGPDTAGAISEGGYLGFAELEYVHIPLPGESLVAFLSDGAFEEQRGSDWSPRWWRAEDSGLATPIMILNGRRIEERTEIAQDGGACWLERHLRLNGFDPVQIDGHDPAAVAWAILDSEERMTRFKADPDRVYPAPLPYVIARAVKGFGFPGAGTNRAHNLPLEGDPRTSEQARAAFNAAAAALFVQESELDAALGALTTHSLQRRPLESSHPAARRVPPAPMRPVPDWSDGPRPPMEAIDNWFVELVDANPDLRVRLGNPDELRSNGMGRTLDRLRHRVNRPEAGVAEAIDGSVITALNEEAVAGAALGNKGGLNLIVSYEAFAVKMLGLLRQEIIFARHQREGGQVPEWIAVPLLATSHTWENGKNEQSHQDPTLAEALFGEMSDTARVLFPVDANSAVAALSGVYSRRGEVACLITPKRLLPQAFSGEGALDLWERGAALIEGDLDSAEIQIVAVGAYQAREALAAAARLNQNGRRACVTVLLEPGRFRAPRDEIEAAHAASDEELEALFPRRLPRLILTHTRPEPMLGLLRRLDGGPECTRALGYLSRGGTLDTAGLLFANRCTWAHAVAAAAELLGIDQHEVLTLEEAAAVAGKAHPRILQPA